MTKSRGINGPRAMWDERMLTVLRRDYPNKKAATIASELGVRVHIVYKKAEQEGLHKSDAFKLSKDSGRIVRGSKVGANFRYKPGHIPWTKGLKGLDLGGRSHETRFKKGQQPHNTLPIGSYRVNSDGYLDRKVSDTKYGPRDWKCVHRTVWIKANGPIPAGHMVTFKKGCHTTELAKITPEILECITLKENMRRNTLHTKYPPEVVQLIQLRGAIQRQINKRKRAQNEKQDR